jgi:hypothetical protein
MSNRAIIGLLALGALVISVFFVGGFLRPKPRLVELKGCGGLAVFASPGEVAAVLQTAHSEVAVVLRGNSQPIPACEEASVVAEKLGHVRHIGD